MFPQTARKESSAPVVSQLATVATAVSHVILSVESVCVRLVLAVTTVNKVSTCPICQYLISQPWILPKHKTWCLHKHYVYKQILLFYFSVCSVGKYGPGCGLDCQCEHGGNCDPISGSCTCRQGWFGPTCQKGTMIKTFLGSSGPMPSTKKIKREGRVFIYFKESIQILNFK